MSDLNDAYSALKDRLDDEGHDDDCVWRCLRNDCHGDHGCNKCTDEDFEA